MLASWIAWLSTYRNVPKKPAGYLRGSSKDKTSARNLQKVQNVQFGFCSLPLKRKKLCAVLFLLSLSPFHSEEFTGQKKGSTLQMYKSRSFDP